MTVKITLEFDGVDKAIVALGRLVGTATSAVAAGTGAQAILAVRRGRSDKGQVRGEYKPRQTEGAGAVQHKAGVTESGSVKSAGPSTVPVAAGPVAPSPTPANAIQAEIQAQQKAHEPKPALTEAQVQDALEKILSTKGLQAGRDILARFGVATLRVLPVEKRREFIEDAQRVVA